MTRCSNLDAEAGQYTGVTAHSMMHVQRMVNMDLSTYMGWPMHTEWLICGQCKESGQCN